MKENQPKTIALAVLRFDESGNIWFIQVCPFCGKNHSHGAGHDGRNPEEFLGQRVPHCREDGFEPLAYELVQANSTQDALLEHISHIEKPWRASFGAGQEQAFNKRSSAIKAADKLLRLYPEVRVYNARLEALKKLEGQA